MDIAMISMIRKVFSLVSLCKLAMILLMLLTAQGCFLPIPSRQLHACGVKGWILDDTGNPIPHAIVNVAAKEQDALPKRTAITDPDGFFDLEPIRRWHGAVCLAPPTMFYMFPYFYPFFSWQTEISIVADGFPEQDFTFDSGREDDYLKAEKIMLYPQTIPNYLASVTHDFERRKRDITTILLGEPNDGGWRAPSYLVTDATLIAAILSEMAASAEMLARTRAKTPNEDILCYLTFLDSSNNVISAGHVIHYDGTIKKINVESNERKVFHPSRPDSTWRIRSKVIVPLLYDVISKIKSPPVHP